MDAVLKTIADQNYYHRYPRPESAADSRMALDVRKLMLALFALLLMHYGHRFVDMVCEYSGESSLSASFTKADEEPTLNPESGPMVNIDQLSGFDLHYFPAVLSLNQSCCSWGAGMTGTVASIWTHLLWTIFVWSFLGLGICRLAAREFVTDTPERRWVKLSLSACEMEVPPSLLP
ncbi:MAG: hypothetical protein R3C11_25810 [Planctomycetaceae bacterium]